MPSETAGALLPLRIVFTTCDAVEIAGPAALALMTEFALIINAIARTFAGFVERGLNILELLFGELKSEFKGISKESGLPFYF